MKASLAKIFVGFILLGSSGTVLGQPPPIEMYVLPDQGTAPVMGLFGDAERSIRVAAYVITDENVTAALVAASRRGVAVVVILDEEQARISKYSRHRDLFEGNIEVRVLSPKIGRLISDFGIVDDQTVYFGGALLHTDMYANPKRGSYLIARENPNMAEQATHQLDQLLEFSRPLDKKR